VVFALSGDNAAHQFASGLAVSASRPTDDLRPSVQICGEWRFDHTAISDRILVRPNRADSLYRLPSLDLRLTGGWAPVVYWVGRAGFGAGSGSAAVT